MRVADSSVFARMQVALGARRSELVEAQERAITGLKVAKPSDDPVAAALAQKANAERARAETYVRTSDAASARLALADSTLSDAHAALLSARDLALQGATDTVSNEDRLIIAHQVGQLREQLRGLANTHDGQGYLFAGLQEGTEPFDGTGAYVASSLTKDVEVAPGVLLRTGVTGEAVFAPPGGVDVFAELAALEQALTTSDMPTARATIDRLSAAAQQVANGRAELGGPMQGAEAASAAATRLADRATEYRSQLVEIDSVDAYSELARAQSALDAAVAIASQLPLNGLIASRR